MFNFVSSVLYVKALENEVRELDAGLADCIGSLTVDNSCPAILINFKKVMKKFPDVEIDMTEGDCTER